MFKDRVVEKLQLRKSQLSIIVDLVDRPWASYLISAEMSTMSNDKSSTIEIYLDDIEISIIMGLEEISLGEFIEIKEDMIVISDMLKSELNCDIIYIGINKTSKEIVL